MSNSTAITAEAIELALLRVFDHRRNFVIPNVSWGFRHLNYEIDVMVVTASLYAYDIEIKISAGDLKRDAAKDKWRYCRDQHYFRKSYFAIPEALLKYAVFIPDHAGIIAVSYDSSRAWFYAHEVRAAVVDGLAKKVTDAELNQLGRLTMLRMWDLKRTIRSLSMREPKPAETESTVK